MYASLMHLFIMHVSMMHVFMMHMSRILDPDACVHDARMYVACIYDPRSLTLMHICMMHIPMILDPDACMYDAGMNDAFIHDLSPYACIPDAGFFPDGRTDGRTNGQADSRSRITTPRQPCSLHHKMRCSENLRLASATILLLLILCHHSIAVRDKQMPLRHGRVPALTGSQNLSLAP